MSIFETRTFDKDAFGNSSGLLHSPQTMLSAGLAPHATLRRPFSRSTHDQSVRHVAENFLKLLGTLRDGNHPYLADYKAHLNSMHISEQEWNQWYSTLISFGTERGWPDDIGERELCVIILLSDFHFALSLFSSPTWRLGLLKRAELDCTEKAARIYLIGPNTGLKQTLPITANFCGVWKQPKKPKAVCFVDDDPYLSTLPLLQRINPCLLVNICIYYDLFMIFDFHRLVEVIC